MNKIIFLVAFIGSLIIYAMSPYEWNKAVCIFIFTYALFFSLYFLKIVSKKSGYYNFHSLFITSFFLINFLHPAFIYPKDYLVPSLTFLPYYEACITKDTSVALVGLLAYMFGSILCYQHSFVIDNKTSYTSHNISHGLNVLALFFSIILFIYAFVATYSTVHFYPRLMTSLAGYIIFCLFIQPRNSTHNNLSSFLKENKIILIAILFYSIAQLSIGARGEVILVLLPLLEIYNVYVKKIKIRYLIIPVCVGLLVMQAIGITRSTDVDVAKGLENLRESESIVYNSLTDFVVNIRGLHDGIYYANNHGLLHGLSYIPYLFAFIPFGSSTLMPIFFGISLKDVQTSHILTSYNDAWYGLGTNIIGDLYMNFSFIGVIIFMCFLGYLVQKTRQSNNPYLKMMYLCLISFSIFLPRADFLVWIPEYCVFVILYIIIRIFYRPYYKRLTQ